MRRQLITALLAASLPGLALAQVYKVTDEEEGVVFTDRPQTVSGETVEKVEIREPNTAAPPPPAPTSATSSAGQQAAEAAPAPTVTISSPANETTIAMGPGNFAVSAAVNPPLARNERLVLLMDGQPVGAEQSSTSWFIEGALRGPHDLVVRRATSQGKTIAVSEPVRVYVLRPSVIGR